MTDNLAADYIKKKKETKKSFTEKFMKGIKIFLKKKQRKNDDMLVKNTATYLKAKNEIWLGLVKMFKSFS